MKLPGDKKKRTQILVLAGMAACGLLYVLWAFAYQPFRNRRAEAEQQLENREREVQQTQQFVRHGAGAEQRLRELTEELLDMSEKHLLHPRLGNYFLEARDIVRRHAEAAGVGAWQAEEIGLTPLPRPRAAAGEHAVQGFAVGITVECGYAVFLDWIRRLEEENPLLNLYGFTIAAQPEKPQQHQIRFELQWPVWVNSQRRADVIERHKRVTGAETE